MQCRLAHDVIAASLCTGADADLVHSGPTYDWLSDLEPVMPLTSGGQHDYAANLSENFDMSLSLTEILGSLPSSFELSADNGGHNAAQAAASFPAKAQHCEDDMQSWQRQQCLPPQHIGQTPQPYTPQAQQPIGMSQQPPSVPLTPPQWQHPHPSQQAVMSPPPSPQLPAAQHAYDTAGGASLLPPPQTDFQNSLWVNQIVSDDAYAAGVRLPDSEAAPRKQTWSETDTPQARHDVEAAGSSGAVQASGAKGAASAAEQHCSPGERQRKNSEWKDPADKQSLAEAATVQAAAAVTDCGQDDTPQDSPAAEGQREANRLAAIKSRKWKAVSHRCPGSSNWQLGNSWTVSFQGFRV